MTVGINIKEKSGNAVYAVATESDGHVVEVDIDRGEESDNWYICATAEDGGHLYDGIWPDSNEEPIEAAIDQAVKGSMLE